MNYRMKALAGYTVCNIWQKCFTCLVVMLLAMTGCDDNGGRSSKPDDGGDASTPEDVPDGGDGHPDASPDADDEGGDSHPDASPDADDEGGDSHPDASPDIDADDEDVPDGGGDGHSDADDEELDFPLDNELASKIVAVLKKKESGKEIACTGVIVRPKSTSLSEERWIITSNSCIADISDDDLEVYSPAIRDIFSVTRIVRQNKNKQGVVNNIIRFPDEASDIALLKIGQRSIGYHEQLDASYVATVASTPPETSWPYFFDHFDVFVFDSDNKLEQGTLNLVGFWGELDEELHLLGKTRTCGRDQGAPIFFQQGDNRGQLVGIYSRNFNYHTGASECKKQGFNTCCGDAVIQGGLFVNLTNNNVRDWLFEIMEMEIN